MPVVFETSPNDYTQMPAVWLRQRLEHDTLNSEEVAWLRAAGFVVERRPSGDLVRAEHMPSGRIPVEAPKCAIDQLDATYHEEGSRPVWAQAVMDELSRALPAERPERIEALTVYRTDPVIDFLAPVLQGAIQRAKRVGWPIRELDVIVNRPGGERSVWITANRVVTCDSGEGPVAKAMLNHLMWVAQNSDCIDDVRESVRRIQQWSA